MKCRTAEISADEPPDKAGAIRRRRQTDDPELAKVESVYSASGRLVAYGCDLGGWLDLSCRPPDHQASAVITERNLRISER